MLSAHADHSLRSFLRDRGTAVEGLDVPGTIATMTDWYREVRFDDVHDLEADGDLLLFQWGIHDFGEGPSFHFDLTRQLVAGTAGAQPDDTTMWQLNLTRHYTPTDALGELGNGNRWCHHPDRVAQLRTYAMLHPATIVVNRLDAVRIEVRHGEV